MIIQLNEKINCQKICKLIEKMLTSYSKYSTMENKAIAINIVNVFENLPKLEYKNENSGKDNSV